LKNFLKQLYDVREGERQLTLLMVALHFLYMVSFYLLKPARDSLFLTELGALQLPVIYIMMAIISVPFTIYLSKKLQHSNIFWVINGTILFLLANLIVLRFIIPFDQPWVYYLFYIWVSLYGIFITSQFWLFANYIFDAAQSKRLFGLLNVGAILGAMAGSELSNRLVDDLGFKTESLIYFCMLTLFIGLVIVYKIYRKETGADSDIRTYNTNTNRSYLETSRHQERFWELFQSIYKSRYQVLILGIVAITMIASTFVDFQFKTIAVESYTSRSEMTSFMGKFYMLMSLTALILQVFVSHIFIRLGGIGMAVIARPATLLVTASMLIINPTLLTAAVMRGADGGLRYSIDKTGRELLFMALPQHVKQKTKIFIDVFVDRFARGIAGLLLLVFVVIMGLSVIQLGYIVAGIVALWITLSLLTRKQYTQQFRSSLLKHQIKADRYDLQVHDQVTLNLIRETLDSGTDSQVLYALNLLEEPVSKSMVDCLKPLLKYNNGEIRLKALKLLNGIKSVDLLEDVAPLLRDDYLDVRLEAILYFCEHSEGGAGHTMSEFLDATEVEIKTSALACISRHSDNGDTSHLDEELINELLDPTVPDRPIIFAQTAIALGGADLALARKYLPDLLGDEAPLVVRETIKAMGEQQAKCFLPYLIEMLKYPQYETQAVEALAKFGPDRLLYYYNLVTDKKRAEDVRGKVFRVFSKIPCQRSVDFLIKAIISLKDNDKLRGKGLKALNNLRSKYGQKLNFNEKQIDLILLDELCRYYHLLGILDVVHSDKHGEKRMLLINALEEKMEETLERIFRVTGLEYPPEDIYGAYLGIRSFSSKIRGEAIEFLDNLLTNELKSYLFPIIDPKSRKNSLKAGRELFDLPELTYEEGLMKLLEGDNMWLKTCAVYFVSPNCPSVLREKVEEFTTHENPLLQETAQLVMQQHLKITK